MFPSRFVDRVVTAVVLATAIPVFADDSKTAWLAEQLRSNTTATRLTAVRQLGDMGGASDAIAIEIARLLNDSDAEVRAEALAAIHHWGANASAAVPSLIENVKNGNPSLKDASIHALAAMGASATPAMSVLDTVLTGDDPGLAVSAGLALAKISANPLAIKDKLLVVALKGIDHPDDRVAADAMHLIHRLQPWAAPAIPNLIRALASEKELFAIRAARALGAIGINSDGVDAALMQSLKHSSPNIRSAAAEALGKISPSNNDIISALKQATHDPDPATAGRAAVSLAGLARFSNSAVASLLGALDAIEPAARAVARRRLLENGAAIVPAVVESLSDQNLRRNALSVLTDLGPAARGATKWIVPLSSDSDAAVRNQVPLALGTIGAEQPEVVPTLIAALQSPDLECRRNAAYALFEIGAPAQAAIQPLSEAMTHSDDKLKALAAAASARISKGQPGSAERTTPILIAELSRPEADTAYSVIEALGELGAGALSAVPALVAVVQDARRDAGIRATAIYALGEIGPGAKAAAEPLEQIIAGDERSLAVAAIVALKRIQPDNQFLKDNGRKVLFASLHDGNPTTRLQAIDAIVTDKAADEPVGPLTEALVDRLPRIRYSALNALADLGAVAKPAAPKVIRSLTDHDAEIRANAAYTLGKIGANDPSSISGLQATLNDPDQFVRLSAAWALLRLDPSNAQWQQVGVPLLVEGLNHPSPRVRLEVLQTLANLGSVAAGAADHVRQMANDPAPMVREQSAKTLMAIQQ